MTNIQYFATIVHISAILIWFVFMYFVNRSFIKNNERIKNELIKELDKRIKNESGRKQF